MLSKSFRTAELSGHCIVRLASLVAGKVGRVLSPEPRPVVVAVRKLETRARRFLCCPQAVVTCTCSTVLRGAPTMRWCFAQTESGGARIDITFMQRLSCITDVWGEQPRSTLLFNMPRPYGEVWHVSISCCVIVTKQFDPISWPCQLCSNDWLKKTDCSLTKGAEATVWFFCNCLS